jgi:hypothetical protein
MSKYIKEFNDTGVVSINMDMIIDDWGILWVLNEWKTDDKWTLIRYVRKDSWSRTLKIAISTKDANELIDRLGLESVRVIGQSYEWRTRKDRDVFTRYKMSKNNKN